MPPLWIGEVHPKPDLYFQGGQDHNIVTGKKSRFCIANKFEKWIYVNSVKSLSGGEPQVLFWSEKVFSFELVVLWLKM